MRFVPDALNDPIRGILVGVVTDNCDPEGINRVQVRYVVPSGDILSHWARMITLMGGPGMGWTCLPEPDDEVLLRFVNGHSHQPVIVGAVHNGKDVPPFDNADGENNLRILHSRNLHKIEFDDTDGSERVSIWSTDEKCTIDLYTADELIQVASTKHITVSCPAGLLKVDAGNNITMEAGTKYSCQDGAGQKWDAGGNVDMSGSSGVAITGPKVDMKA